MNEFLYKKMVCRDVNVQYEYERYVREHLDEHYLNRLRHIRLLLKLNWHYRLKKKEQPYIYWDRPTEKETPEKKVTGYDSRKEVNLIPPKQTPYVLAKRLMSYDVISFDVFDTLIFRPFERPQDLFIMLQEKFNYPCFCDIRIEMEKRAREYAFRERGSREVTIGEIYELIERYTGINKDYGISAEIELEKELIKPNIYMQTVFNLLKANGKRIIICSDMYLSSDTISEMLNLCGYAGFDAVFVSNELRANKGTGDLFDMVTHRLPLTHMEKICHIGDNYLSDIKNARAHGWDAIHYPACNDRYKKKRYVTYGMSELIGSAYGGIVNTKFYNGLKSYNEQYSYGFICGGIYVLGYCSYIQQYVLDNNIDKVLFLSRDGAIYEKVFQLLPNNEIPFEYIYWSRIASLKLVAEKDKYDFLTRIVRHRKNDIDKVSTGSILDMLGLTDMKNILSDFYGIKSDDIITGSNCVIFEKFFLDNWNEILRHFEKSQNDARLYFEKAVQGCNRVLVVDVGWQGSGCLGLKWLIEEKWKMNCKVHCVLAGSKGSSETSNISYLENETLHTYMFSRILNRDVFDWFAYQNSHTNTCNFETFTQAQAPTFWGMVCNNGAEEFKFGVPEVENIEMIGNIHKGIYDFAKEYIDCFKNYQYMFNISGRDAIQPFRYFSGIPGYIRSVIGTFAFSRNVCCDEENIKLGTIAEILDKQGIK